MKTLSRQLLQIPTMILSGFIMIVILFTCDRHKNID